MRERGILPRGFYVRDTVEVAEDLLGKILVRTKGRSRMIGRIVEVEAYKGQGEDPASHAFRGLTRRNAPMFAEAGHAYVYFTYGNHYCLNATTERVGTAGAVLIRALQPLKGLEMMRKLRPVDSDLNLASGPGKLTKSLGIDTRLNEVDLTKPGPLFIKDTEMRGFLVGRSGRVGIGELGADRLWRFYVEGNPYVSRKSSVKRA